MAATEKIEGYGVSFNDAHPRVTNVRPGMFMGPDRGKHGRLRLESLPRAMGGFRLAAFYSVASAPLIVVP